MSLLLKQHQLLKLLVEHYLKWENTKQGIVAVDFESIFKFFNCNKDELQIISAQSFTDEEIGFYNVSGIEGLHIKPKGISSYATKKYIKQKESIFFERVKNWVQVSIPVLSLTLAILIFVKSNSKLIEQDKELQSIKLQVSELKKSQQSNLRNVKPSTSASVK